MIITNLENYPQYREQTLKLIEKSFGYDDKNKFEIDFYPLMEKKNLKNCFILLENNNVLAHIAVLKKQIQIENNSYNLNLYGGIAVSEEFRGKGLFAKLFNDVLLNTNDCSLQLLWSDKIELYKKFNFFPAISQYEFQKIGSNQNTFEKICYNDLGQSEKAQIHSLYYNHFEHRILRTPADWKSIEKITSADFYVKKLNNKIMNYFVINKGADLSGVIHEYGLIDNDILTELQNYGKVWTSSLINNTAHSVLYSSLIKPAKYFKEFIESFTSFQIKILNWDLNYVQFLFDNKEFNLSLSDFLTGIFGPGQFEELTSNRPLFICGLDSI